MSYLQTEAQKAIKAEVKLQDCYRRMSANADTPKMKAVIHDLLLMEEMNEVLLRSLNDTISA